MRTPRTSEHCVCGQTWSEHGADAGWKPCQHPVTDLGRCLACRSYVNVEELWEWLQSTR